MLVDFFGVWGCIIGPLFILLLIGLGFNIIGWVFGWIFNSLGILNTENHEPISHERELTDREWRDLLGRSDPNRLADTDPKGYEEYMKEHPTSRTSYGDYKTRRLRED